MLNRAARLDKKNEKRMVMRIALQAIAQRDHEKAFQLAAIYGEGRGELATYVVTMLARNDPEAAILYAEQIQSEYGQTGAVSRVLSAWADRKPLDALAYVDTMAQGQQSNALQSIAPQYIRRSPEEAFDWAMGLDSRYQSIKYQAISVLVSKNPELAENRVDDLADQRLRIQLIKQIATKRTEIDPQGALDWLQTEYGDEDFYAQARVQVLQHWSNRDPEGVANLIWAEADQPEMGNVISNLAQQWYHRNQSDAETWVKSLPRSDARDNALRSIILSVAHSDTDKALDLADVITNDRIKSSASMVIADAWAKREPGSLDRIINVTGLNTDQAATLRRRIEQQNSGLIRE